MASPLAKTSAPAAGKMRLVRELLGPYHRWLALILAMSRRISGDCETRPPTSRRRGPQP